MANLKNRCKLIVVAHRDSTEAPLPDPFTEICVFFDEFKPEGYKNYFSLGDTNLKFPAAWSEVAVLLSLDSLTENCPVMGLQHYRRFFIFDGTTKHSHVSMMPALREDFVKSQLEFLDIEIEIDNILVPKKWKFNESAWDQFISHHPELGVLMSLACEQFDILTKKYFGDISSQSILQESNYLFPYNMFLGKIEFYLEWKEILEKLVIYLEDAAMDSQDLLRPRWGGYIIERLFSVFIVLSQRSGRWNFNEKTVVIFDGITLRQSAPQKLMNKIRYLKNRLWVP